MGAEIAKCLTGPVERHDGYLVTRDGTVTWGFGHILRQAEPDEYDSKYKMWRSEDLPIVPEQWKLMVDKSCQKQFAIIRNLIAQADEIVHAGDPDREGQLLIDEVLDYLENQKPVKRILLNALDEKSIRKANGALRDNQEFFNLKQSALARARADWLIGMNLSRAYTLAARRAGHKIVLPIGRVKTPTLALVVRRERELENFVPVDYYTIKAEFLHDNGSFQAAWKPPMRLYPYWHKAVRAVLSSIRKQKKRKRSVSPMPCPPCRSWPGDALAMIPSSFSIRRSVCMKRS